MSTEATKATPPVAPPDGVEHEPAELIPSKVAAAMLDVSGSTFNRIVRRGEIPFYSIGRRQKFRRSEVLAYIEGRRRIEAGPSTNLPAGKPEPPRTPATSTSSGLIKPGRKSLNPFANRLVVRHA